MINCPYCKKGIEDYYDYCPNCGTEIFKPNRAFIYEQLFELMKLQENRRQQIESKAHTYVGLLSIVVTINVALGGVAIKNITNMQLLMSNNGFKILSVLYFSTVLFFIIGVLFALKALHEGGIIIKIADKYLFSWYNVHRNDSGRLLRFLNGIIIKIADKYLFSWDNVPGNDSGRLLRFLKDDLAIDWAKNAKIRKSDGGKTICILNDDNSAIIVIGNDEEKATLEIRGGRTYDLRVRSENGKLNIYKTKTGYDRLNENWLVENSEEGLPFIQKNMIHFLGITMSDSQRCNTVKTNNLANAYYSTVIAIFSLLLLCVATILSIYILYK